MGWVIVIKKKLKVKLKRVGWGSMEILRLEAFLELTHLSPSNLLMVGLF